MIGIPIWLDARDKEVFLGLRTVLKSSFMEENSGMLGDLFAWVPMFVFLAIVLYLGRPGSAVFSLFFGLAAFVLSFQASMLLANVLYQPSPVKLEYILNGVELPAYGRAVALGLPDWGVAALVASFQFTLLRLRQFGIANIRIGWVAVAVFCILRIYAGYTYPLGVFMGILVGVLVAWLMFKLARSVELLSPSLTRDDTDNDQGNEELP